MGYLHQTLATLRRDLRDYAAPPWTEDAADAWLVAMPDDFFVQRQAMIEALRIRLLPLRDRFAAGAIERALDAMATVPREDFLCPVVDDLAYLPGPVDIGQNQIMSHPELVAVLAAAADPRGGCVLDVGTGSGYQAAVLSRMGSSVTSIEIIVPLARLAAWRLQRGGFVNVSVAAGDAAMHNFGCETFDAIVVAAGAAAVPAELLRALRPGGRLIMPVGPTGDQEHLVLVHKRRDGTLSRSRVRPARFVPLTGAGARTGITDAPPR
ncbi:protein-L-isoaspartate O-methyltransferase family protein [Novosphingobium acidiphilum]|uniref:protein-L-isoaspartate O-methyltransferase family protein n=1 Tax=Novosphingobium acidiphilum TaxID=505248 RepID=UPI000422D8D1|nr:protein-L-isoaspartate O-methyltransferase [Novosphingobium acidiphilum]